MRNLSKLVRMTLAGAGCIALGLAAVPCIQAQTYSSSEVSYEYQYNPQYNTPNYNQNYNNQRTPRYTGHSWADHLVLEGGGGVTPAAGSTQNYANTGFNILLGAGFKFNNRLSLLAEWNFNRMGVPYSLAAAIAGTPGGNEHIWTTDLNPKFDFIRWGRIDGYVIGGGGFSRALTNFTYPVTVYCYDFYFGGYPCSGTLTVAHTSTNQANFDIGGGAEWRVSPYERGKIFVEARYEKLFSPNNGLPPGNNATLVPVTFGYRW